MPARFLSRLRQSRTLLFFFLAAFFAALACILRTVGFFISFDADIGYFRTATPIVIVTNVCILVFLLLCVTISFLINKEAVPAEQASLPAPRFIAAAINALLLCITALFLFVHYDALPAPTLLVLLAAVCLLVCAVYFLLRLCNAKLRTAAAAGILTIPGAALVLAITYFDRYTQMNAPHKLSLHLCMLSIMFAMLYELRDLLGRPAPRACVLSTAVAAGLCCIYALSNIIAFLGGVYENVTYLMLDLVALGFAAFFITKSIRFASLPDKTNTEVEE